jgi:hypothetical protein
MRIGPLARITYATLIGLSWWNCTARAATVSEQMSFRNLDGEQCFVFSALFPTEAGNDGHLIPHELELVISDQQQYEKIFNQKFLRESCRGKNIYPLAVDFKRHTVLGLWTVAPCFATRFAREVRRDDEERTITYVVTAVGSVRACMGPGIESLNLIEIAKVPVGYRIIFGKKQSW